jgi:DNA-3-methyladenine glycosylase I
MKRSPKKQQALFPAGKAGLKRTRRRTMFRCPWCESDPLLQKYHDEDWGARPCTDKKHFEFLMLECAQAGLSWMTVLRRREAYREAFAKFDANTVAGWGDEQIETLMQNPGIIRNKQKITAALKNARAFLQIQKEFGSFDAYLLSFFGGRPLINDVADDKSVPAITAISQDISLDMKARGFAFMGPTVVYSHLQAAGIADDHVNGCFRKGTFPPSPPVEEIKLKTLSHVGKALKKAGILFGVGGSAMLYRNGLVEDFNDIDLIVALEDAIKADEVLLSLGTRGGERSSGVFETKVFRSYEVDSVGVDMMAGLAMRHNEGVYRYDFREDSVCDTWPVYGTMLPFCALEDWCVLYHLMPGKENKAERIKAHFGEHGVGHPALLSRMLTNGAPAKTVHWLNLVF